MDFACFGSSGIIVGKTLRAPPPRFDAGGATTFGLRSAKNKKARRTIPMPPLLLPPSEWVGRPSYPETQILRCQRGWKFTLFHLPSAILGCKLSSARTRMHPRPNDAAKSSKLNSDVESMPPRPLAENRQDLVF